MVEQAQWQFDCCDPIKRESDSHAKYPSFRDDDGKRALNQNGATSAKSHSEKLMYLGHQPERRRREKRKSKTF